MYGPLLRAGISYKSVHAWNEINREHVSRRADDSGSCVKSPGRGMVNALPSYTFHPAGLREIILRERRGKVSCIILTLNRRVGGSRNNIYFAYNRARVRHNMPVCIPAESVRHAWKILVKAYPMDERVRCNINLDAVLAGICEIFAGPPRSACETSKTFEMSQSHNDEATSFFFPALSSARDESLLTFKVLQMIL